MLGTSTVTIDAKRRGIEGEIIEQDKKRTTLEHGWTIVGMCLKEPETGTLNERKYNFHPDYDESLEYLENLFN